MSKQFKENVNSIVDSVAKLGNGAALIHTTGQPHTIPTTIKRVKRRR